MSIQCLAPFVLAQSGDPNSVPLYSPPEHSSCEVPAAHHQHNPARARTEALQRRHQLRWLLTATLRHRHPC